MLKFYTYKTINGEAVSIALAEMAIEHECINVDLFKGENRLPDFLALNPSGRIPVVVDEGANGELIVVDQTGAILLYLAEKTGQFLPVKIEQKAKVMTWLFFQLTDISPNIFNNFYLKSLIKPNHPEAADILKARAVGFYQYFDSQLSRSTYLAGEETSISDFATFPVVHRLSDLEAIKEFKNISRWYQQMCQRPAIKSVFSDII